MQEETKEPLMRFFLIEGTNHEIITARMYWSLANQITETVPRSAERTVALRKLLESRDSCVRAIKFG